MPLLTFRWVLRDTSLVGSAADLCRACLQVCALFAAQTVIIDATQNRLLLSSSAMRSLERPTPACCSVVLYLSNSRETDVESVAAPPPDWLRVVVVEGEGPG